LNQDFNTFESSSVNPNNQQQHQVDMDAFEIPKDFLSEDDDVNATKKRKKMEDKMEEDEPEEQQVLDTNLLVKGKVKAKAFIQLSDIRLKTNIEEIVGAMDLIRNLKGRTYNWKNGEELPDGERRVIGMIAQEVQKVLPDAVYEDPITGILSVSYTEILPVLVEAFKELASRIEHTDHSAKEQMNLIWDRVEILEFELEKSKITNQVYELKKEKEERNIYRMLQNLTDQTHSINLMAAENAMEMKSEEKMHLFKEHKERRPGPRRKKFSFFSSVLSKDPRCAFQPFFCQILCAVVVLSIILIITIFLFQ